MKAIKGKPLINRLTHKKRMSYTMVEDLLILWFLTWKSDSAARQVLLSMDETMKFVIEVNHIDVYLFYFLNLKDTWWYHVVYWFKLFGYCERTVG